jgi:2-polyprenyl-3-methyl-5-hydroxy-6-metoxy-1,4-benzoquinol methylase
VPPHPTTRGGLLEEFLSHQRVRVANRLIPPASRSGRLLDLGCGEHPRFLLATDFAEKHGVDRRAARQEHAAVTGFRRSDCDFETVTALPFADSYFDVVTMLAVFEHIDPPKLGTLVSEIHRILKPGGTYILTTPAAWTHHLLLSMATLRIVDPVQIAEHKDAYSRAKIASILRQGGFAEANMRFGFFEAFMNVWATARK